MDHFRYKNGVYHAEDCAIPAIVRDVGTPCYCYSRATFEHHFQVFRDGVAALDPLICFAVKSNGNPEILRILARQGAGADVVSEGEIRLARQAGIPASKIIFSGVGKQRREMAYALEEGVFQFNVESVAELHVLNDEAGKRGVQAPIALRINPNVDAHTHAKITTGTKTSKFGIAMDQAESVYELAATMPHIAVQGVSVHIGSQLTDLAPFRTAYCHVRQFVEMMRARGHPIRVVDLGGGLGIPYMQAADAPPLPQAYGAMIADVMDGLDAVFAFEPGRMIAGNAGILVSEVIYTKQTELQTFLIIDAAMNDLARPALYDAHHDIVPVTQADASMRYHVVGPVCESSDIFGRDIALPMLQEGDLVALRSAGAYGAVMANQYNARALVPEVLVEGDQYRVIRHRQPYDAMYGRLP